MDEENRLTILAKGTQRWWLWGLNVSSSQRSLLRLCLHSLSETPAKEVGPRGGAVTGREDLREDLRGAGRHSNTLTAGNSTLTVTLRQYHLVAEETLTVDPAAWFQGQLCHLLVT